MNLLQRLLCLLLCFSLLFCVFSVSVSAEEVKLGNLKVEMQQHLQNLNGTGSFVNFGFAEFYPNNNIVEYNGEATHAVSTGSYQLETFWIVSHTDGTTLFVGGRPASVTLEKAYHSVYVYNSKGSSDYARLASNVRVLITYSDNTYEYIDEVDYSQIKNNMLQPEATIKFSFTPQKDVLRIEYQLYVDVSVFSSTYGSAVCYLGEAGGDVGFFVDVDQQSEEAGLLGGIIGWIKNIFESIGNIASSIIELPSKIWELISNGLKALFVPSEDYINEFKTNMDSMLSNKLGAIYQVVDITLNSWDRIQANDESNTIDFPKVSIPLPEDNTFEFGGQQVQIVPEGFEFLATSVKTIVGISCTVLFINGLKKRYDEVMGGKE